MSETGYQALAEMARRAWEEALKRRGRLNIIIAGRTGVGKSTLINAVFHGNLAETGQGRPVTREIREITKDDVPVSIFDTCGLEMDRYQETSQRTGDLLNTRRGESDPARYIRVARVCVSEESRRIEDGESALVGRWSSDTWLSVQDPWRL